MIPLKLEGWELEEARGEVEGQLRPWAPTGGVQGTAHLHRCCLPEPCHKAVLFSRTHTLGIYSYLFRVTTCKLYTFLQITQV